MKNCVLAPRARRGFTLIEILVVIGVIALLSAILFPVFGRVRETGRRTACNNNLRQLGMAFAQYLQDNRRYPLSGCFYNGFAGVSAWDKGGSWVAGNDQTSLTVGVAVDSDWNAGKTANVESGAIYTYVKNPSVYMCPSAPHAKDKHLSYSMNCAVTALSGVRIKNPTDIVLLVDEANANDGYFYAVYDDKTGAKSGAMTKSGSTDALIKKHNGGGNLLFADGHVKFFPYDALPLDDTPAGLDNKWRDTGSPRFHDRAFGLWGSNSALGSTADYCNATKRD